MSLADVTDVQTELRTLVEAQLGATRFTEIPPAPVFRLLPRHEMWAAVGFTCAPRGGDRVAAAD